jgi:hypothetical protein
VRITGAVDGLVHAQRELRLICSVNSQGNDEKFTWTFYDGGPTGRVLARNSELVIGAVQDKNAGAYLCSVTSIVGAGQHVVPIMVRMPILTFKLSKH